MIDTRARLHGATDFVKTMRDGIPKLEEQEQLYLRKLAEEGGWEYEDFVIERDILGHSFQNSIPEFAAFSSIILLDSIVETQLDAFGTLIGKSRDSKILVKHMAGQGMDRSALYLKHVFSIDIKTDPAWSKLQDLHSLRNIIVHRGGKRGLSLDHQKSFDEIIRKYSRELQVRENGRIITDRLCVSFDLCLAFAETCEEFFQRIFETAGLTS